MAVTHRKNFPSGFGPILLLVRPGCSDSATSLLLITVLILHVETAFDNRLLVTRTRVPLEVTGSRMLPGGYLEVRSLPSRFFDCMALA